MNNLIHTLQDLLLPIQEGRDISYRANMVKALRIVNRNSDEICLLPSRVKNAFWNLRANLESGLERDDIKAVRDYAIFAYQGTFQIESLMEKVSG